MSSEQDRRAGGRSGGYRPSLHEAFGNPPPRPSAPSIPSRVWAGDNAATAPQHQRQLPVGHGAPGRTQFPESRREDWGDRYLDMIERLNQYYIGADSRNPAGNQDEGEEQDEPVPELSPHPTPPEYSQDVGFYAGQYAQTQSSAMAWEEALAATRRNEERERRRVERANRERFEAIRRIAVAALDNEERVRERASYHGEEPLHGREASQIRPYSEARQPTIGQGAGFHGPAHQQSSLHVGGSYNTAMDIAFTTATGLPPSSRHQSTERAGRNDGWWATVYNSGSRHSRPVTSGQGVWQAPSGGWTLPPSFEPRAGPRQQQQQPPLYQQQQQPQMTHPLPPRPPQNTATQFQTLPPLLPSFPPFEQSQQPQQEVVLPVEVDRAAFRSALALQETWIRNQTPHHLSRQTDPPRPPRRPPPPPLGPDQTESKRQTRLRREWERYRVRLQEYLEGPQETWPEGPSAIPGTTNPPLASAPPEVPTITVSLPPPQPTTAVGIPQPTPAVALPRPDPSPTHPSPESNRPVTPRTSRSPGPESNSPQIPRVVLRRDGSRNTSNQSAFYELPMHFNMGGESRSRDQTRRRDQ